MSRGLRSSEKVLDPQKKNYYTGQETVFILNEADQLDQIRFNTIQGFSMDKLVFYNHLGLLIGEVWRLYQKKVSFENTPTHLIF